MNYGDRYTGPSVGLLVIILLVAFVATFGALFAWDAFQDYMRSKGSQPEPYQAPADPGAVVPTPVALQWVVPTENPAVQATVQANQTLMSSNYSTSVAVLPTSTLAPTAGPDLVPYELCRDTRIYDTTDDSDAHYLGFLHKGETTFIVATSPDKTWIKFYTEGQSQEWWTPISYICTE